MDRLHEVQERVSRRIAERLAAHFGRAEPRPAASWSPASPGAYVLYLRANQLAYETSQWIKARDLYQAALRDDPNFAPAWVRLGRCQRVIAKFVTPASEAATSLAAAETAFTRADPRPAAVAGAQSVRATGGRSRAA